MNQAEAENIVSSYIASRWPGMVIMSELTEENESCYSIYIQSKDYVKSRNKLGAAVGHGVFIVSKRDSQLFATGSGLDPKEAVERFEKYGDPYVAPRSSKKVISNPNTDSPLESTEAIVLFRRITGFGLLECSELVKAIDNGKPFESDFEINEEDLNSLVELGYKLRSI